MVTNDESIVPPKSTKSKNNESVAQVIVDVSS